MNKKLELITSDVIEECLCESLDILEKNTPILKKNTLLLNRTQRSSK